VTSRNCSHSSCHRSRVTSSITRLNRVEVIVITLTSTEEEALTFSHYSVVKPFWLGGSAGSDILGLVTHTRSWYYCCLTSCTKQSGSRSLSSIHTQSLTVLHHGEHIGARQAACVVEVLALVGGGVVVVLGDTGLAPSCLQGSAAGGILSRYKFSLSPRY